MLMAVLIAKVMFSLCLFVCLLAGYYSTDFHKIWRKGGTQNLLDLGGNLDRVMLGLGFG